MSEEAPSINFQSMGGRARAEKLSPEERKAIASAAARARWQNEDSPATNPRSDDRMRLDIAKTRIELLKEVRYLLEYTRVLIKDIARDHLAEQAVTKVGRPDDSH